MDRSAPGHCGARPPSWALSTSPCGLWMAAGKEGAQGRRPGAGTGYPSPSQAPRLSSPHPKHGHTRVTPSKPHHFHPRPGQAPRPSAQSMQSGQLLASASHFKGFLLPDVLTPTTESQSTEGTVHRGDGPQTTEATVHRDDSHRGHSPQITEATVHRPLRPQSRRGQPTEAVVHRGHGPRRLRSTEMTVTEATVHGGAWPDVCGQTRGPNTLREQGPKRCCHTEDPTPLPPAP